MKANFAKFINTVIHDYEGTKFGPKTLKALKEQDAKSFIIGFSERRRNYYKGLKNKKFDEGWQNRANKCEKYCLGII